MGLPGLPGVHHGYRIQTMELAGLRKAIYQDIIFGRDLFEGVEPSEVLALLGKQQDICVILGSYCC